MRQNANESEHSGWIRSNLKTNHNLVLPMFSSNYVLIKRVAYLEIQKNKIIFADLHKSSDVLNARNT